MKKSFCLFLSLLLMCSCSLVWAEEAPVPPLYADYFENMDADQFDMVFQLTIDAEGAQIALAADEELTDFVIECGTMDENGVEFLPEYELFAAKVFAPHCLLAVRTYFSDTVPLIRISFTRNDAQEAYYLMESGQELDNPYLLIDVKDFI